MASYMKLRKVEVRSNTEVDENFLVLVKASKCIVEGLKASNAVDGILSQMDKI